MEPARTRFAPSPTGSLHVGGVRTALYCYLWARRTGGQFVLRIEDTDRKRSSDEATESIVADLRWCGLAWDEGPGVGGDRGPYVQSARRELYQAALASLLDADLAYEAWDTPEELQALRRQAEADKRNFRYRRRTWTDEQIAGFRAEGRSPVIRLAAPRVAVTIDDHILGEITVDEDTLDDLVIVKADGWPTYHFAVVVDDHQMDISLILRGQEHVMNTHKHELIYRALGWDPVEAGHLPLIFNPEGSKMGKRDKAKAARAAARAWKKERGLGKADHGDLAERSGVAPAELDRFMAKKSDSVQTATLLAATLGVELPMIDVSDFRKGGYLPEALVNYMALLGWSPGHDLEIMSLDEMASRFSLDRVIKTPARFNPAKLSWMNGQYMKSLPDERLAQLFDDWLDEVDSPLRNLDESARSSLLSMYRPRAATFVNLARQARFFFEAPAELAPKARKRHLDKGDGWERLAAARDGLASLTDWTEGGVHGWFTDAAEAAGLHYGKLAQPVRVAVTGNGVSPELASTVALLGRDETLSRIEWCLGAR